MKSSKLVISREGRHDGSRETGKGARQPRPMSCRCLSLWRPRTSAAVGPHDGSALSSAEQVNGLRIVNVAKKSEVEALFHLACKEIVMMDNEPFATEAEMYQAATMLATRDVEIQELKTKIQLMRVRIAELQKPEGLREEAVAEWLRERGYVVRNRDG